MEFIGPGRVVTHDDDGKAVPLNAGSRGMARDPAEIYERQEARTCAGCEHVSSITILGESRPICAKGKRYGKRCRFYVERQPTRR